MHKKFVKKEATQWSELACLPYFDLCCVIVIDPMHNLFLGMSHTIFWNFGQTLSFIGLVKTQFYHAAGNSSPKT